MKKVFSATPNFDSNSGGNSVGKRFKQKGLGGDGNPSRREGDSNPDRL